MLKTSFLTFLLHWPTVYRVYRVWAANIVWRPCSDSSHIAASYKLSFNYYHFFCSLINARRSFCRNVNCVFGKIGKIIAVFCIFNLLPVCIDIIYVFFRYSLPPLLCHIILFSASVRALYQAPDKCLFIDRLAWLTEIWSFNWTAKSWICAMRKG